VGAKPVFVDIDPATYNLNPAQIAAKVTPKTRAVIPVHLYGQMADMDAVMEVARQHKLVVIEDAAQAIGAEYKGRRAGSIGDYGCFSFFPSKNLGAVGDGGMVVTNDAARAENLVRLRAHGSKPKYYHKVVGGNFRLDTLQAAVVTAKLKHLDDWTLGRQRNAARYDSLLASCGLKVADSSQCSANGSRNGTAQIFLPKVKADRHIFNQYIIRTSRRDALKSALQEKGVGTEIYYPVPMHLQECFSSLGHQTGAFPESESAAKETLALPIYPELTDAQAQYVVQCVRDFFVS
jgi:dTDP-4-amino-4,6-dideoxygalactose transaminase